MKFKIEVNGVGMSYDAISQIMQWAYTSDAVFIGGIPEGDCESSQLIVKASEIMSGLTKKANLESAWTLSPSRVISPSEWKKGELKLVDTVRKGNNTVFYLNDDSYLSSIYRELYTAGLIEDGLPINGYVLKPAQQLWRITNCYGYINETSQSVNLLR